MRAIGCLLQSRARGRRCCVLAVLLAAAATAHGQPPNDPGTESAGAPQWSFEITPYLWAAGLDGDTAAQGVGSEIDTDYHFLSLDNLDFALGTAFEANKGRWTALADAMYVSFSDAFDGAVLRADAELSGGFLEGSGAYSVASVEGLDVVFGMRFVELESTVRLTPGPSGNAQKSWLDPLVGARFRHAFNDRWSMTLRGDIGGFGVGSELATNASAVFGLRLTDAMTLRFGYRILQMDFDDDGFVLDAVAQGYAFGLSFTL